MSQIFVLVKFLLKMASLVKFTAISKMKVNNSPKIKDTGRAEKIEVSKIPVLQGVQDSTFVPKFIGIGFHFDTNITYFIIFIIFSKYYVSLFSNNPLVLISTLRAKPEIICSPDVNGASSTILCFPTHNLAWRSNTSKKVPIF